MKKNSVTYDGKKIYYTNETNLVEKIRKKFPSLNSSQARRFAKELISGSAERIVVNEQNEFEKVDLRLPFKKKLKEVFNKKQIKNVPMIVSGEELSKGIDVVRKLDDIVRPGQEPIIKVTVNIILYISWYENIEIDNGGEVNVPALYVGLADGEIVQRNRQIKIDSRPSEIEEKVQAKVNQIKQLSKEGHEFGKLASILAYRYEILTKGNEVYDASNYYVGDVEYKLEEWTNIEYLGRWKNGEDSCAVKFIHNRYPDLYFGIKKIETSKGVSVKDFEDFCTRYKIPFIFLTITGKEFKTNKNKFDLSKFHEQQILRAIIHEGHIYPFRGGKLIKCSKKPQKKVKLSHEQLYKKLEQILDNKIVPKNYITSSTSDIISFTSEGIKYFHNDDYDRCVEILNKIGIIEKIPTTITFDTLIPFILKIRKLNSNLLSFLPESEIFKMKAITWEAEKIDSKRKISGADKNKAYIKMLASLPYLLVHDWRQQSVKKCGKDHQIVPHYLYTVRVKEFTIPLPSSGMYPGYELLKRDRADFELIEEFTTITRYNIYTEIFEELSNILTPQEFKNIGIKLIGKMERSMKISPQYKCLGIHDIGSSFIEGQQSLKKIGNHTIMFNVKNIVTNVRNMLPINVQVKCAMYSTLYEKIRSCGITAKDLVQINTDCFYFYGDSIKGLDPNDFHGWKEPKKFESNEWFKEAWAEDNIKYLNNGSSEKHYVYAESLHMKNQNNKIRILHSKYAGAGKTTYICKVLIPKLEKLGINYIVLTPTHSTLDDYKDKHNINADLLQNYFPLNTIPKEDYKAKHNINADLLQNYSLLNTIPKEDYIIIDEIGFSGADTHDFLHKLCIDGKAYECFGDFNQMLPPGVDSPFNQSHYLNYMFNYIDTRYINYRNYLSKDYYNDLINGTVNLKEEVKKYNTSLLKADIAICYRKSTRNMINSQMLKHYGLEPYSPGTKLICKNNKLKEDGIWNNKEVTMISSQNGISTLSDGKNTFTIPLKKVKSNFDHGYCITIYAAQGKTYNSYHWPEKDDYFFTLSNANRMAYTLISRLSNIGTPNEYILLSRELSLDVRPKITKNLMMNELYL